VGLLDYLAVFLKRESNSTRSANICKGCILNETFCTWIFHRAHFTVLYTSAQNFNLLDKNCIWMSSQTCRVLTIQTGVNFLALHQWKVNSFYLRPRVRKFTSLVPEGCCVSLTVIFLTENVARGWFSVSLSCLPSFNTQFCAQFTSHHGCWVTLLVDRTSLNNKLVCNVI
jgi:hypothetical protein